MNCAKVVPIPAISISISNALRSSVPGERDQWGEVTRNDFPAEVCESERRRWRTDLPGIREN